MAQNLSQRSGRLEPEDLLPKTARVEPDEQGSASGAVLVAAGQGFFATRPLPRRARLTIGRSPELDLSIPLGTVSRKHAVLSVGPPLTVEDLGSQNGTFVNNEPIAAGKPCEIRPGDIVRIGKVSVWIELAPAKGAPGAPAPAIPDGMVVVDPAMKELYAIVERVARSPINVLVTGETGTGKEVIARAIHARSPRPGAPFLGLNCAAFSEGVIESELFGHERGSFTGAGEPKPGLLETAQGGTVFLDEVTEMSLGLQAKLLRVLEERTVLRVGAVKTRPIDVRFVAASNRELEAEVEATRFRKDLYFRLNGVTLTIPPLRARRSEIEPLARRYARSFCAQLGTPEPELSREALDGLERYAWPGNVRELRNVIERAVLLAGTGPVEVAHLQLGAALASGNPRETDRLPTLPAGTAGLKSEVEGLERERILSVLASCAGNQRRAAKELGISRNTLSAKLDKWGVPRPRRKKS